MIVREREDEWVIVMQPDHGVLAGDLAAAWADRGPRHQSLVTAARRHDDGWAVWECSPQVDESGRPIAVFDVDIRAHLAFYRAGIAAITEEDSYAGLLVSMHGAGIYQHRYGSDPGLVMAGASKAQDLVDAFVAEQEASHGPWSAELGVDDELLWADYHRLQWFDRLSLALCMNELYAPEPEAIAVGDFALTLLGLGEARISPNPFTASALDFTVLTRRFPKGACTQDEFRRSFTASAPQQVAIRLMA